MKRLIIIAIFAAIFFWGVNKFIRSIQGIEASVKPSINDTELLVPQPRAFPSYNTNAQSLTPAITPPMVPSPAPSESRSEDRSREFEEDFNQESPTADPYAVENSALLEQVQPNSLVSCHTYIRFCEPRSRSGQINNPDEDTFCVTYASNCIDQTSIQRVWRPEEVYQNNPSPQQNYSAEQLQYREQQLRQQQHYLMQNNQQLQMRQQDQIRQQNDIIQNNQYLQQEQLHQMQLPNNVVNPDEPTLAE